jgi:hypothetical protein
MALVSGRVLAGLTANLRRYSTAQANHQVGSVETPSRPHRRAETSPVAPAIKRMSTLDIYLDAQLINYSLASSKGQHASPKASGQDPESRPKVRRIAHHLATLRQMPPPSPNTPPTTTSFPRINEFLGKVPESPTATPAVKPNPPKHRRDAVKEAVKQPSVNAQLPKRKNMEERKYPPVKPLMTQAEDRGPKRPPRESSEKVQLPPASYFPPVEEIDFGKLFRSSSSTGTPPLHPGSDSKMLQLLGGDYSRHLPQHLQQVEGNLTPSESAQKALARRKDIGLQGRNTVSKVVKSASQGRGGKQQT